MNSISLTITLLINIGFLVFDVFLIKWLFDLDTNSCECSKDWKKDYIKHWLMLHSVFVGINIIVTIYNYFKGIYNVQCACIMSLVLYIIGLLNFIFSIMYIKQLKNIDCKCTENRLREFYYIYSWIILILNVPIVLILLFSFFYQSFSNNKIESVIKSSKKK